MEATVTSASWLTDCDGPRPAELSMLPKQRQRIVIAKLHQGVEVVRDDVDKTKSVHITREGLKTTPRRFRIAPSQAGCAHRCQMTDLQASVGFHRTAKLGALDLERRGDAEVRYDQRRGDGTQVAGQQSRADGHPQCPLAARMAPLNMPPARVRRSLSCGRLRTLLSSSVPQLRRRNKRRRNKRHDDRSDATTAGGH